MSDELKDTLPFEFEGKSLSIAVVNYDIEQTYTNWLEMRARDKIARRREELERTGDYVTHMRIWQEEVSSDNFDFSSRVSWQSRWNEPGQKYLVYLMILKGSRDSGAIIDMNLVDKIFANKEKYEELLNTETGLYWRAIAMARPTSQAKKPTG